MSSQLSSSGEGGYAYDFVHEPGDRFQCTICCLVLRDPVQTPCGHHFCQVCIQRWLRESRDCPIDRRPLSPSNLFPDVSLNREILGLTVRCPSSNRGCSVVTALQDIRAHYSRCDFIRPNRSSRSSRERLVQPAVHTVGRSRTERQRNDPGHSSRSSRERISIQSAVHTGGSRTERQWNGDVRRIPAAPIAPPPAARHEGASASGSDDGVISCPFCDLHMNRGYLDVHLYMCETAFVPCPNGCEALVCPPNMEEHLTTCPMNLNTCHTCGLQGSAVEIQNHSNVCPRAVVACGRCRGPILRDELQQHNAFCPGRSLREPARTGRRRDRAADHENRPLIPPREDDDVLSWDNCTTWQKVLVGFVVVVALPALLLAEIAVGATYYKACPAEPYIPMYLVMSGAFGNLCILLTVTRFGVREGCIKTSLSIFVAILYLFLFAWFIAGSVWIYSTKGHFSTASGDHNFCDPTLYWFAFGVNTAVYGLMALGCTCCTFLCTREFFCVGGA